jgi:hypothetical protein
VTGNSKNPPKEKRGNKPRPNSTSNDNTISKTSAKD